MSGPSPAADIAQRLAQNVEAVCRTYLSKGRRAGDYWVVGDVQNSPGKSLYVRLSGPDYGAGAKGKWSDGNSGEHGDLVDLIRLNCGFTQLRDALDEARSFLRLPHPPPEPSAYVRRSPAPQGSCESARRLFAASRPLRGNPGGTLSPGPASARRRDSACPALSPRGAIAGWRMAPRTCPFRP